MSFWRLKLAGIALVFTILLPTVAPAVAAAQESVNTSMNLAVSPYIVLEVLSINFRLVLEKHSWLLQMLDEDERGVVEEIAALEDPRSLSPSEAGRLAQLGIAVNEKIGQMIAERIDEEAVSQVKTREVLARASIVLEKLGRDRGDPILIDLAKALREAARGDPAKAINVLAAAEATVESEGAIEVAAVGSTQAVGVERAIEILSGVASKLEQLKAEIEAEDGGEAEVALESALSGVLLARSILESIAASTTALGDHGSGVGKAVVQRIIEARIQNLRSYTRI